MDPVELATERLLNNFGIRFTRPTSSSHGHPALDFYLTDYQMSIEVKAWSCERMHDQIRNSGLEREGVIIIIGIEAVFKLGRMLSEIRMQAVKELSMRPQI